jgi:hypothetical protein
MKKMTLFVIALTLFPAIIFAAPPKPLCEFFASYPAQASISAPGVSCYYDGRFRDRNFFTGLPNQHPNGGIKLSLETGIFKDEVSRADVVNKIKCVTFSNQTSGLEMTIEQPEEYTYTTPSGTKGYAADFYVWLGSDYNVIGSWTAQVQVIEIGQSKPVKYETEFDISEAFLELPASDPVKNLTVTAGSWGSPPVQAYRVCFENEHNPNPYRIRGFDSSNIIYNTPDWIAPSGTACWYQAPLSLKGKKGRVEARYPRSGLALSCPSGTWVPSISRTNTYFIFP